MKVFLFTFALLLTSCAATDQDQRQGSDATVPADNTVTIIGTVTDEGVECPAIRTDRNELYTIAGGDRNVLRPGVRVRVTGTIAEMSICQQGTTISATKVEVVSASPSP